jgi:hypothetical protein
MKEKEFYRDGIVKMVKKIDNQAILRYIYNIISDIIKERRY